tara:strand:- start:761 stop:901 length:141 start_codon:yes stop_codon:yes gene_type:complete
MPLLEFLSEKDLIELKNNKSLLDTTRKVAKEELIKRKSLKAEKNDV